MKNFIIALKTLLFFTILTGIFYPLLITGIAQLAFSSKANGSLIVKDNQIVGSKLIGQSFDSAIYFIPRPSAVYYNSLPSGGSNLGLTNTKLKELVDERRQEFIAFNHLESNADVPSEMLFASASGLDPHISKQAAMLQVDRIAKARNFNAIQKQLLLEYISLETEKPQMMIFGEERVNVLLLNFDVDKIQ